MSAHFGEVQAEKLAEVRLRLLPPPDMSDGIATATTELPPIVEQLQKANAAHVVAMAAVAGAGESDAVVASSPSGRVLKLGRVTPGCDFPDCPYRPTARFLLAEVVSGPAPVEDRAT
jgi:hypothetical protein